MVMICYALYSRKINNFPLTSIGGNCNGYSGEIRERERRERNKALEEFVPGVAKKIENCSGRLGTMGWRRYYPDATGIETEHYRLVAAMVKEDSWSHSSAPIDYDSWTEIYFVPKDQPSAQIRKIETPKIRFRFSPGDDPHDRRDLRCFDAILLERGGGEDVISIMWWTDNKACKGGKCRYVVDLEKETCSDGEAVEPV